MLNFSMTTIIYRSNSTKGDAYIEAQNGAVVDLPQAQIITRGIIITETGIKMDGALILTGQSDMKIKKIDYRAFDYLCRTA